MVWFILLFIVLSYIIIVRKTKSVIYEDIIKKTVFIKHKYGFRQIAIMNPMFTRKLTIIINKEFFFEIDSNQLIINDIHKAFLIEKNIKLETLTKDFIAIHKQVFSYYHVLQNKGLVITV